MRLHTFTLVVFDAVLAHSATSGKTSNSTKTEGAPSASLRSSDACCDDVPVEQGLGPHETTAGEERMTEPWIPSSINSAVAHLGDMMHGRQSNLPAVENLPVHKWREFDQIALRHYLEATDKEPKDLLQDAQLMNIELQMIPENGPDVIAKARQFFSCTPGGTESRG
ncbi:unnamed protein product [Hyaloperonospora brassicae]|uniref:RxLR effector candidate protein n=1 Tax=Hyaloperonospora brassicae TaxID=162125 RepID=A0AAV0T836_HYABA|nr:unnamed protein product [Hyaloperonospora brassicae]